MPCIHLIRKRWSNSPLNVTLPAVRAAGGTHKLAHTLFFLSSLTRTHQPLLVKDLSVVINTVGYAEIPSSVKAEEVLAYNFRVRTISVYFDRCRGVLPGICHPSVLNPLDPPTRIERRLALYFGSG